MVQLALKRQHLPRPVANIELVVHRAHSPYALNSTNHIVHLITQRNTTKRHPIVVREHLDSLAMLDRMVELGAHACRKLVVRARLFLQSCLCALPCTVACICQQQRRPDSEARDQSKLSSPICRHWSLISVLVGGRMPRLHHAGQWRRQHGKDIVLALSARKRMTASRAFFLSATLLGMATADPLDNVMQPYAGGGPGASVIVIRHGKVIARRSYGLADLERHVQTTPSTNYRLASVTKQFTAASILLLAQDSQLSVHDRVKRWLPSLPAALDSTTIENLLTHTSGIVDYEDVIPDATTGQLHDADVLRLLESHDSTYFKPGSGYRYSNGGYALLALIVERASGQHFAVFLHDRIFAPLKMNRTVAFEDGVSAVSNRAFGYKNENGAWTKHDQSITSAVLGDGGIYTSVDDLAKWDAALYDSRLLSDESRRLAFSPHTTTNTPDVSYGYGWRITGDMLWHTGETAGFRNVILRYPARQLTVVVLTNRDEPGPYNVALAIAKLYM